MLEVKRPLASFIGEILSTSNSTVILTGHAGDGKTALLFQILQNMSSEPLPSQMRECGMISLDRIGRKLLWIKDMSELSQTQQNSLLLKALRAPSEGHSAILVSNTGPLLSTFERIRLDIDPNISDRELQMQLLDGMDKSDGTSVTIGNLTPRIFNMARIDTTSLALDLLDRMLSDTLWKPCALCDKANMCPIYGNRNDVLRNRDRVCSFISAYLTWLNENDRRLTIRQILAQMAYGITAGLSCREIVHADVDLVRFNYSFANAFWGYRGTKSLSAAEQIHGIRAIRALELDSKSLDADYAMFVQGDLSMFDEPIRNYLTASSDPLKIGRQDSAELRRSFRRFFYLFANTDEGQTNKLFQSLFSPVFPQYMRAKTQPLSPTDRTRLKTTVFRALYRLFVGFLPSPDEKVLYLTVRRPGDGYASVQMLYGEVAWTDFDVRLAPTKRVTEGTLLNELQVHFKGLEPYPVSLPLLHYFHSLSEGAVATRLNPALSHGLDRLRSALVSRFRYTDHSIRVLIKTSAGTRVAEMVVDNQHLTVS